MARNDLRLQGNYWAHIIRGSHPRSRLFWGACVGVPMTTLEDCPYPRCGYDGWLYAIREERTPLVKIGGTRTGTRTRLAQLTSQLGVDLVLVGVVHVSGLVWEAERAVHRFLAAQRIEREWFYLPMNQAIFEDIVAQACPWIR
jgi:hypothetical protein